MTKTVIGPVPGGKDRQGMTPTPSEMLSAFGRIGLLSFGGPAAQIAVMHRELVDDRKWMTEAQFLRALSFCMMLPGPEAMQLATYAGWRLRGTFGGVLAGLLFVLPGAVVITALAAIYISYGEVPLVQTLFLGVKATVIVIVAQALARLSGKALKGAGDVALAVAAFVALFALHLPFPLIIALAALIFAKWRPWYALYACLLFGLLQAVALRYQNIDLGLITLPVQFMDALPYVLTVVILAGFVGKAIPPRAGGQPYVKER